MCLLLIYNIYIYIYMSYDSCSQRDISLNSINRLLRQAEERCAQSKGVYCYNQQYNCVVFLAAVHLCICALVKEE
jgi:hypothetical protein